jgi:hypothetical protein
MQPTSLPSEAFDGAVGNVDTQGRVELAEVELPFAGLPGSADEGVAGRVLAQHAQQVACTAGRGGAGRRGRGRWRGGGRQGGEIE